MDEPMYLGEPRRQVRAVLQFYGGAERCREYLPGLFQCGPILVSDAGSWQGWGYSRFG